MAQYLINGDILTDIANSIRSGKGTTNGIYPTEFAEEITAYVDSFRGIVDGSIVDLVIPEGAKKVRAWVFGEDQTIKSVVMPDSVTEIGDSAFRNCQSLTYVTFGNGAESIGTFGFYLTSVKQIVLPDSLKTIGVNAFRWCPYLTSVTFGKGLKTIESEAFWDCGNCTLYDFSRCESVPHLVNANAFDGWKAENRKILVPDKLLPSWVYASNWVNYRDMITTPKNGFLFWNRCMTNDDYPTFGEWLESDFDKGGLYANSGGWLWSNETYGQLCYTADNGDIIGVKTTDIIDRNKTYYVS